ncbi:hypothetical protein KCU89_g11491, partial [Aureobasidium melanogenum]
MNSQKMVANLLAPLSVKSSNEDTWGNIKVPWLPDPEGSTGSPLSGNWSVVPDLTSTDNYTSLVGLPLAGLIRKSRTQQDFTFDYAYMDLECPLPAYNMSIKDSKFVQQLGLVWSSNNKSMFTNDAKNTITSFFLDTHTPMSNKRVDNILLDQSTATRSDASLQAPRKILFGSLDSTSSTVLFRNFTVKLVYFIQMQLSLVLFPSGLIVYTSPTWACGFTYNNAYMNVPPGGESLGAMDRARLLRDVKVKIGDARADDEVGHVVFATLDCPDLIGDLSLARHYR